MALTTCALTHEEIPTKFTAPVLANSLFQSTITSRANRSNVVESTGSLPNSNSWTLLTNFLNRTGSAPFTYPVRTNDSPRFFRAKAL